MEKKSCFLILVEGIVQGVGFRPFIYNLALSYKLKGYVRNTLKGVEIEVCGILSDLHKFIEDIRIKHPPFAIIKSIKIEEITYRDFQDFHIESSQSLDKEKIFILPDIGICKSCEEEFRDKKNRFFKYPFITCTDCGPRYSIIQRYPYDRINTTMSSFYMCDECRKDYTKVSSRRFHAETISCYNCGPKYFIFDNSMKKVETDDIWGFVNGLLKEGKIIAIKGIGGYHLVLDAKNYEALKKLRERKRRDRKPFALMAKDLKIVEEYCLITEEERLLLTSAQKPIVLLKKKKNIFNEDDLIAGSSPYYGVMLPYAPVHFHLIEQFPLLVCTSANISGEPIVYVEDELDRLNSLADYFVVHNREIVRFVEDSVIKVEEINNRVIKILFRKSRGYAPLPIFLKKTSNNKIIGLGGDLKATVSILKEDVLIQSQYLGDLGDYNSYLGYKECIRDLQDLFMFNPEIYVCDLHPGYISTNFAEELSKGKKLFKVQHHKAHIASVILEKGWFDENVLGIALDGTGYGEDGQIWGGEIFIGNLKDGLIRVGGLSYMPFPFGDRAVKEPERTFLAYFLASEIDEEKIRKSLVDSKIIENYEAIKKIVKNSKVYASSTGRLFDAVSFLLGFKKSVSYEGESAIELENLIYKSFEVKDFEKRYKINILKEDNRLLFDVKSLLWQVFFDYERGLDNSFISLCFHSALVEGLSEIAKYYLENYGIKRIALSGGSFHNQFLLYHFFKTFEGQYEIAINEYSPPNDACISVGQCAYFAFRD
ncbi:MAG: carbamoyltransferase HypF [Proteobacteria bacterium]|nr:carbamoyltransferase HypF [Pseudomonadota bacterium]